MPTLLNGQRIRPYSSPTEAVAVGAAIDCESLEQTIEFWRLNLAELAAQCTLAECDPICLAYGRRDLCGRQRADIK